MVSELITMRISNIETTRTFLHVGEISLAVYSCLSASEMPHHINTNSV